MTINLSGLFDPYNRYARLMPALISVVPVGVLLVAVFPQVYAALGSVLVAVAVSFGVVYGLTHVSRYLGRQREQRLIELWDGLPSTRWLRHRDSNLDVATKRRYHGVLERCLHDAKAPSPEMETNDPVSADAVYRSMTRWLIERTRDRKQYAILFDENVSYGFRRNSLGMKPLALLIGVASLVTTLWHGVSSHGTGVAAWPGGHVVAAVIIMVAALYWMFLVSPRWVRDAAEAYARALLATCDSPNLNAVTPPKSAPPRRRIAK